MRIQESYCGNHTRLALIFTHTLPVPLQAWIGIEPKIFGLRDHRQSSLLPCHSTHKTKEIALVALPVTQYSRSETTAKFSLHKQSGGRRLLPELCWDENGCMK